MKKLNEAMNLQEGPAYEIPLFKALEKIPGFKNLSMDRQGEIYNEIVKLVKKG